MRRHPGRERERGAVAVMTAVAMTLVLASTALGVDVGGAAFEQRDLQKIADLAALDAVRAVGDLRPPPGDPETAAARALRLARESVARNGLDPAEATNQVSIELGTGDPQTRAFLALPPGADELLANAVRVTAGTVFGYRFMPGSLDLTAGAIAINEATAEITVGSRAARATAISTGRKLVDETLHALGLGSAELDAASYEGLVGAEVTLGDLWVRLSLGSPDEIANAEVSVADLVDVTVDALEADGGGVGVTAATALREISRTIDRDRRFRFRDLIEGGIGTPGAVADATVSVFDLLLMTAEIANGDHLVEIEIPVAQVPGVASGTVSVGFIEKPAFDVGPALRGADGAWVTRARTAQARIQIDLRLEEQAVLGTQTAPIDLPLYVESASALAELTAIGCAAANQATPALVPASVHASTSSVTASIGTAVAQSLTNPHVPPEVADAVFTRLPPDVVVAGSASVEVPGTSKDVVFTGPFDERVDRIGATTLQLGSLLATDLRIDVAGTALPTDELLLAARVRAALIRVLDVVDARLIDPLATTLGIRVAGADVTNPWLECAGRRLIG